MSGKVHLWQPDVSLEGVVKLALYVVGCLALCVACSGESANTDSPNDDESGAMAEPDVSRDSTGADSAPARERGNTSDGGRDVKKPDLGPAADAATSRDDGGTQIPGPSADRWRAGDYPSDPMSDKYLEITGVEGQKGYARQYKVHIPPSYDPDVPTPTVFCIHGLTQNAIQFCVVGSGMIEKSDKEGFILIMPNGYQASWNAGTCCGAASGEQLDDVALIRAIFAEVGQHVNIDRGRVYATGFSNGGFMSYRLACEAADIFAAVAPSAGGIGTNEGSATWELVNVGSIVGATNASSNFTECAPSKPISVLDLHGTSDGLVPHSFQRPSLDLIAQRSGCASTTEPAQDPMSRGDTTCVSYTGCPSGIEVTGCTVENGGHNWFGSPDCGTAAGELGCAIVGYNSTVLVNTEAVWNFFKHHKR